GAGLSSSRFGRQLRDHGHARRYSTRGIARRFAGTSPRPVYRRTLQRWPGHGRPHGRLFGCLRTGGDVGGRPRPHYLYLRHHGTAQGRPACASQPAGSPAGRGNEPRSFPQPGDRIWTPADWAWIGGLLDVLMPALHHGITVVARRFEKFDPEAAFQLLQDFEVRNAFIPPTALKMMRNVPQPEKRWRLCLRSVASGGESLGSELLEWGRASLGVTIHEVYRQT